MKPNRSPHSRSRCTCRPQRGGRERARILLPVLGVLLVCLLPLLLAQAPSWWAQRGVVNTAPASDFAAANQGQLKTFVLAAYEEFLAKIPATLGGIGPVVPPPNLALPESPTNRASPGWRLRNLLGQWVQIDAATGAVLKDVTGKPLAALRPPGTPPPTDFAAINLGQIKAVTAPFYDRLAELYWSYNSATPATTTLDPAWAKPWTDAPGDDNNHAMANLGQLKRAFALDLDSDADSDGLSNLAELLANANRGSTAAFWTDLGNPNTDGDMFTDRQEVAMNLNPTNVADGMPPAAPQNLRIAFPDAAIHPSDTDLSQIRVEWNAPTESIASASFSETFSGSPNGWGAPVTLSPSVTSRDFFGLLSKLIYGYRVTFTATNGLASSSEISYELPVIRGIMMRTVADGKTHVGNGPPSFEFPGVQMYADAMHSGVPRKFRSFRREWSYSTTYEDEDLPISGGTSGYWYYDQNVDLATRVRTSSFDDYYDGWQIYYGTSMDWNGDENGSLELTEPSGKNPAGRVLFDYSKNDYADGEQVFTETNNLDLSLELKKAAIANIDDYYFTPQPLKSLDGTGEKHSFNVEVGQSRTTEITRNDTISLVYGGADGYRALVEETGEIIHTQGGESWSEPLDATYIADSVNDLIPLLGPEEVQSLAHGEFFLDWNPPEGAEIEETTEDTSWSRTYTYDDGRGYTETWTETVTLTDEITTDDLIAATVATFASFDAIGIPWFIPDGGGPCYGFTNQSLQPDASGFPAWLGWDYTGSYIPASSGSNLGALVGKFSLDPHEISGSMLCSEYRFRVYPPAESTTILCVETFTPDSPDPLPVGWTPALRCKIRILNVTPGQTETPAQTVDRTQDWALSVTPANAENQPPAPQGRVTVGAFPSTDLDIIHPATGDLDEGNEDLGDGGYVPIKRANTTPVTKLALRASSATAGMAGPYRLKFNQADKFTLWKDAARASDPVVSEVTEFDSSQESLVYFQGLKKSASRGGERATLQSKVGDQWIDGDHVSFTIVQSEFLFQIKAFIPYAWTRSELPRLTAATHLLSAIAVGGDNRGFRNVYSDSENAENFSIASFRCCHTFVLAPYEELHTSPDVVAESRLWEAPLSNHYAYPAQVHPADIGKPYGNLPLIGLPAASGKPKITNGPLVYGKRRLAKKVASVDGVIGGGIDGAIPIASALSLLPAIDWNIKGVIVSANDEFAIDGSPLNPKIVLVSGNHDPYPAWEIIVNQSDGSYIDLYRNSPAAGALPGPSTLSPGSLPWYSSPVKLGPIERIVTK